MKVLQVNTVFNQGSTGRIVADLMMTIQKCGGDSKVVARNSIPNNQGCKTLGLEMFINIITSRLVGFHGHGAFFSTKKILRFISDYNPDIIHLHNIHGYFLNIGQFFDFLKKLNKPIVWTLHDCWAITGHCAYFSAINCNKWKSLCHSCPQLKTYPSSLLFDRSESQFKFKKQLFNSQSSITIVTVSKWLSNIVGQSFLCNKPRVVINNGVDLNVFKYTSERLIDTDKYILLSLASKWSERKGLKDCLELSKQLKEDELLVLVGLNDKEMKMLPSNIIGLRNTNNIGELVSLYSQAGIVLSLSVEETFGMTIIEGFACGTPSIVYNSTATPELIDDSVGLVVEPHDISGVREAINSIRISPIDFKNNCINKAKRLYDKNDRYQDYISLYKKLINENLNK